MCMASYSHAQLHSSSMSSSMGRVTTHLPPCLLQGSSHSGLMPFLKRRQSVLGINSVIQQVLLYMRQKSSTCKIKQSGYSSEGEDLVQLVLVESAFLAQLLFFSVGERVNIPKGPSRREVQNIDEWRKQKKRLFRKYILTRIEVHEQGHLQIMIELKLSRCH